MRAIMNSSFFIFRSLTMKSYKFENKKASRPHDFREGVLAFNSPFHFHLRRTPRVPPVWPHITLKAFFNDGGRQPVDGVPKRTRVRYCCPHHLTSDRASSGYASIPNSGTSRPSCSTSLLTRNG